MDPFGVTSDPRLYVPRRDSEAALAALRVALVEGRVISLLSGPAGLGKTTVLHALANELSTLRFAHLPYAALDGDDLAALALEALGEPAPKAHAREALAALACESARPIVLLVDDASALPLPTARALRDLAFGCAGRLRLVCALVDDARASGVAAALGEDVVPVRLLQPLTPDELRAYLRGRLERAGAERTHSLHDAQIDWIAAESGGIPRRANQLAASLLRGQCAQQALMLAVELVPVPEPAPQAPEAGAKAAAPVGAREPAAPCATPAPPPEAPPHSAQSADPSPPPESRAERPPRRRRQLGRRYGRRFSSGW